MAIAGMRTCPNCLTRVLPGQDGLCPACRRFDFNRSPSDEATVRAAQAAAHAATTARLYEAAILHWRLVSALGVVAAALLGVVLANAGGGLLFGRSRGGESDAELLWGVAGVAIVVGTVVVGITSARLSRLLHVEYRGRRTMHAAALILRDSMTFFEDHKVPMSLLGPRLNEMQAPESPVDE
jgi:hypothetical protein